jgi:DNA-directed RNA polymerase specialized sigma24 family protein
MGVHWGRIRRHGAAPAYARTTLVRLAIRSSHKRKREAPTPDLDRVDSPAVQPVPGLSPEMTEALNALGVRQRTTVVLRHVSTTSHSPRSPTR